MPEVKSRKTVFVKGTLGATATFNFDFRVGFDVDDIIVTGWTTTAGGAQVFIMSFNGVGEIFHFRDDDSQIIRNIFKVGKSLDGIQTFTALLATGALAVNALLDIIFTVECIEFHK
jgi:hypothetical protein